MLVQKSNQFLERMGVEDVPPDKNRVVLMYKLVLPKLSNTFFVPDYELFFGRVSNLEFLGLL